MTDRITSYTAAGVFPAKLFYVDGIRDLRPVHVQWIPTNHCNLKCTFCSCSKRDKSLSMPIAEALAIIRDFVRLGCKAVTITGGGEPLCHDGLPAMIDAFAELGVEVGLVTNGLLLSRLSIDTLGKLTWCRVSNSDDRTFSEGYRRILDRATAVLIDWAFSHVVTIRPNLDEIERIVDYANEHGFTHVRLVGDLMNPDAVSMTEVRDRLAGKDQLVIYQPRKAFVRASSCLIGYVKPTVTPDFNVYLCCGAQYALAVPSGDFPPELSMGSARELAIIYHNPQPFRVSCVRCYYRQYNELLARMTTKNIKHQSFI